MNTDLTTILALFEHGTGYTLNRVPDFYFDFGGAKYSFKFTDGGVLWGTVTCPGTHKSSAGFHFGHVGEKVVREHGADLHDEALLEFIRRNPALIRTKIEEILQDHLISRIMGEAGLRENEKAGGEFKKADVEIRFGDKAEGNQWSERWVPAVLLFVIVFERKPEVKTKPFEKMSDKELDAIIWEHTGVESITCDGEIPRSRIPARMRKYREEYRAMSPRRQNEVLLWVKNVHPL